MHGAKPTQGERTYENERMDGEMLRTNLPIGITGRMNDLMEDIYENVIVTTVPVNHTRQDYDWREYERMLMTYVPVNLNEHDEMESG